jgi:hypothetical protein
VREVSLVVVIVVLPLSVPRLPLCRPQLAKRAVPLRQVRDEIPRAAHRAEEVQREGGGLFVEEAVEGGVLEEVEAGRVDEVQEGGADGGGGVTVVAEGRVGVEEAEGRAEVGEPGGGGGVVGLEGREGGGEFGLEGGEGEVGERGEGEVVGEGVDFVAADEVGFGGVGVGWGGLEGGDVADCARAC